MHRRQKRKSKGRNSQNPSRFSQAHDLTPQESDLGFHCRKFLMATSGLSAVARFPDFWVLQIGQAFGLMPGGFSPGLPPPILEKANRSQGRGAKPWATRGLVRSRQPGYRKGERELPQGISIDL